VRRSATIALGTAVEVAFRVGIIDSSPATDVRDAQAASVRPRTSETNRLTTGFSP